MITRKEKFNLYSTHPMMHKTMSKLSVEEKNLCRSFINENDNLDRSAFEMKVNRMFLDKTDKPKEWTRILELLIGCNL